MKYKDLIKECIYLNSKMLTCGNKENYLNKCSESRCPLSVLDKNSNLINNTLNNLDVDNLSVDNLDVDNLDKIGYGLAELYLNSSLHKGELKIPSLGIVIKRYKQIN